jgi:transcriptional regulator with XRE-family HTH domain
MFHNAQIKILRDSKGWSLADTAFELAKLSHRYTRQTILNWETGVTVPKASDLGCLAEVFGVSVQSFFEAENK